MINKLPGREEIHFLFRENRKKFKYYNLQLVLQLVLQSVLQLSTLSISFMVHLLKYLKLTQNTFFKP